jgi:hypothetical protein
VFDVMGDTRCDSVLERRDVLEIPELPLAAKDMFVFVAGSTWPPDEACIFSVLKEALNKYPELFLILAPHEPTEEHLKNAEIFFSGTSMEHWSRKGGCRIHMKIDFLGSKNENKLRQICNQQRSTDVCSPGLSFNKCPGLPTQLDAALVVV